MNTISRSVLAVLIATISVATIPTSSLAETAAVPIVVVDLNKVFEQHPSFRSDIDAIRASVKNAEGEFMKVGQEIEKRAKQLKSMPQQGSQYKQLESETARLQAQTQADMSLKRKDFLEQEAKVYYSVYQQVQREIKVFAESNRIGIVLRYSSEKIDPTNRQSVMQGVNQPIVYNQAGLDITNYIVDRLHRLSGGQRTANAQTRGGTTPQRK